MRKTGLVLLILMLTVSLVLGGCGGQQPAEQKDAENKAPEGSPSEVYELSLVSEYMDKHPSIINGLIPWINSIGEKTEGKVKITYYNPNTLCPQKDTYDSTVSGMVDIGNSYCGYYPGKFPLNSLMELPLIAPGAEAGSLVTWELYKKYPEWQKEFQDTKMLWQWASATFNLHTTKKQVKTLEDLKGMKIIGWTPNNLEILRLLGANPIEMTSTDTYLALERGTADGVLCPIAPLKSYKISDAAKYHTIVDISVGPFFGVMNQEKFDSLPADIQKLLEETTGENMARVYGQTLDQGASNDAKWLKENGHEFYVVPEAELERWFEAIKPMHEKWVKDMEAKGYANAQEILDQAISLGKEIGAKTGRGYQE